MSLAESLVSLVLTLVVTSAALSLATPTVRASAVQPELADVQQRARVALEMMGRDVAAAGSGRSVGPQAGLITGRIPALFPRRLGSAGDGPAVARSDSISMISVPAGGAAATLASDLAPNAVTMTLASSPGCGSSPLCGLSVGDDVLVGDSVGTFDVFRITGINGLSAAVRPHGGSSSGYVAGSAVTEVVTRTYYLDAATAVLRQADSDRSDQPSVDHVSALDVSYFGDGAGGALTPIPLASLSDGPWLGAGVTAFDADLLRVRLVRLSATTTTAGAGLSARVRPWSLWTDVAPRSLGVGR